MILNENQLILKENSMFLSEALMMSTKEMHKSYDVTRKVLQKTFDNVKNDEAKKEKFHKKCVKKAELLNKQIKEKNYYGVAANMKETPTSIAKYMATLVGGSAIAGAILALAGLGGAAAGAGIGLGLSITNYTKSQAESPEGKQLCQKYADLFEEFANKSR